MTSEGRILHTAFHSSQYGSSEVWDRCLDFVRSFRSWGILPHWYLSEFCLSTLTVRKAENMTKRVKKGFTVNYNGEAIRPGEVMIPFEYTELDAECCTNPECIKTVRVGGRNFKVIYKAVLRRNGQRTEKGLLILLRTNF